MGTRRRTHKRTTARTDLLYRIYHFPGCDCRYVLFTLSLLFCNNVEVFLRFFFRPPTRHNEYFIIGRRTARPPATADAREVYVQPDRPTVDWFTYIYFGTRSERALCGSGNSRVVRKVRSQWRVSRDHTPRTQYLSGHISEKCVSYFWQNTKYLYLSLRTTLTFKSIVLLIIGQKLYLFIFL